MTTQNKKTVSLINRSISEDVQYWQIEVLNTSRNTENYSKFKYSFKTIHINYKDLLKEMDEILMAEEMETYFWDTFGAGTTFKYGLEMNSVGAHEAETYVRQKYNFDLAGDVTSFMTNLVAMLDARGNMNKEGPVLFEMFGQLSRKLELGHPESPMTHSKVTMKDINEY